MFKFLSNMNIFKATFLLVLWFSVIISLTLFFNLAVSSIFAFVTLIAGVIIWKSQPFNTRRNVSENIFIVVTSITTVLIILLVLYLLVTIFLNAKSHLSWSFFFEDPAEGLTEGGIFPAIIGTALLVIIMSIIGVPIGTITAIYLTEYARESSWLSKLIRFAVNTLSGVPAIVFGLFGLGFFIGTVGKAMDKVEFNNRMNKIEVLFNSKNSPFLDDNKAKSAEIKKILSENDPSYWEQQINLTRILEEMHGTEEINKKNVIKFFNDRQRPKWGQPALIWAALTMALLTLPVVIVSVEEAIKTVPGSLREASLALGATKFKTILKVVLPGSITGIMTGGILAVSRGAGEVAPILFTGAAYYLPDLPTSLNSQFMELGYHIYVLATQSTDVEATLPLQYATTFVLLILTFVLNFSAIFLRSKIRAKLAKVGQ